MLNGPKIYFTEGLIYYTDGQGGKRKNSYNTRTKRRTISRILISKNTGK